MASNVEICFDGQSMETLLTEDMSLMLNIVDGKLTTKIVEKNVFYLPDGMTEIASNAFKGCGFEKVVIPASVKYINDGAFSYCKNLKEVVILGENLSRIDKYAFSNCHNLRKIKLPPSVKYIMDYAFIKCINLEEVIMSINAMNTLGSGVFVDCTKLEKITFTD